MGPFSSPDPQMQTDPQCLMSDLAHCIDGVVHAVLASGDGLPLAASDEVSEERAANLAAASAALTNLATGAAQQFEAGSVRAFLVTMSLGHVLILPTDVGSMALQVNSACDIHSLIDQARTMNVQSLQAFRPPRANSCPSSQGGVR
jgi:predicted regulator of Ras-like GTPase activity (Roadblock/LC7/MglB family)